MMYAVEATRKDTQERAETVYFDDLIAARIYADIIASEGKWAVEILETTGESGDAGKRID